MKESMFFSMKLVIDNSVKFLDPAAMRLKSWETEAAPGKAYGQMTAMWANQTSTKS